MIISISGSQGQGKSTVLNSLEEIGYKVSPNKTARSILSDWGYTLNEVNKYPPLTKQFQEEILVRHSKREEKLLDSNEIYFVERSYADFFTYAIYALGSYNEYDEWLNDYYHRCLEYQSRYRMSIYLTGRNYKPQDDGVRSVNVHFMKCVDMLVEHYIYDFSNACNLIDVLTVNTPDHDLRIHTITNSISQLNHGA